MSFCLPGGGSVHIQQKQLWHLDGDVSHNYLLQDDACLVFSDWMMRAKVAGANVQQCFMQDQNVACHDLGKVSFERAVGCFGKPRLERATRFPMPQLERATRFPMSQLERATRFPNVPSRARDSLLNCQFKVCVFDCFCHSMPFICLNITSINYINYEMINKRKDYKRK